MSETDEHKTIWIERFRALQEETERYVRAFHPPCPVDQEPGAYVGETGSYQILVRIYQCPTGHIFSYRSELPDGVEKAKLIAPERWAALQRFSHQRPHPSGSSNDEDTPQSGTPNTADET